MSSYKELASQHLSDIGVSGGASITQKSFQNVTQDGVVTVTHASDITSSRIVQIAEFESGGSGLVNTSLDFDPLDETNFIQEDSVSGTDFVNGSVTLHSLGGTDEQTFDPDRKGVNVVLTNSNRTIVVPSSDQTARTIFDGVSSGKYYWEFLVVSGDHVMLGIYSEDSITTSTYPIKYPGNAVCPYSLAYHKNGNTYSNMGTVVSASYGPVYIDGDVIGVALDCDNNTINFAVNNTWYGTKPITSGKVYFPGASSGSGAAPASCIASFIASDLQYLTPDGFESGFNSLGTTYQINSFYITTSDSNQISTTNITEINSCTVTTTTPASTSIKCLASFDDRSTWQKWGGASWAEHSDGLTNLQTGNTITELQTGFTNLTVASGADYLDFAFDLGTTDSGVTPELDQITINYDEAGRYDLAKTDTDYAVSHYSTTQTKVTKDSVGTENIKVNILI